MNSSIDPPPRSTDNSTLDCWCEPPQDLKLSSQEVHVWLITLDASDATVGNLLLTLCPEERQRAERFYFPLDRDRFITCRGRLRQILSRYLTQAPPDLHFNYNQHGKPALADGNALSFNVSHSHGLALIAVTQNREVGVDLEYIRADLSCAEIVEKFFSSREKAMWRSLPKTMKTAAFFTGWTRKEAYIKATGKGLSLPLHDFDVALIPGQPARLLDVRWDVAETNRWTLQEIPINSSYAAALAVSGKDFQTQYYLSRW
jgi:4'-phosphopantetheinyl transferase